MKMIIMVMIITVIATMMTIKIILTKNIRRRIQTTRK